MATANLARETFPYLAFKRFSIMIIFIYFFYFLPVRLLKMEHVRTKVR